MDGTAGTIFQVTPDGKPVWKYVVPLDKCFHLRQGERPSVWKPYSTPHGDPVAWLTNAVYRAYWIRPNHPALQALDLTPGAFIEDSPDIYDRTYAAGAAALDGDFGDPLTRSDFDIYLDENGRRLIYIMQPCAEDDARANFFLHIIPADASALPFHRQEHGFDNLDFNFNDDEVKASDGRCVALRDLPRYPIERIRTGQFTREGQLWQTEINLNK